MSLPGCHTRAFALAIRPKLTKQEHLEMRHERSSAIAPHTADNPLLTVIITVRAAQHYDMIGRLYNRKLDTEIPGSVSFLVVDESSDKGDASRLAKVCRELAFTYVRAESDKSTFCAATARNAGAVAARSKFIMHEDVDLFPYPGFYKALIDEITVQGLHQSSDRFITIPALYLSECATVRAICGELSKNEILHDFLTGGALVDTYLPASSAIIVDRMYYLSIGGYNTRFNGWGLEDLEFAYRLTRSASTFLSPAEHRWLIETGYSTSSTYRGWRAQFRLHGELLSRKGLFVFHAHHPRNDSWRNKELHAHNKLVFSHSIERFDREGHFLPPLPAEENGRSLIFGNNPLAFSPALLPLWGNVEVKGERDFAETTIVDYVLENRIDRVILTDPYANVKSLSVYKQIRDASVPFVVVGRGALPNSVFIDDTGFCYDSTRYRSEHWPSTLDADRLRRVKNYILSETESHVVPQSMPLGASATHQRLGIPSGKKVLLIPFQSRSEMGLTGNVGSFDNFIELVSQVTKRLPPDWAVILKERPLSDCQETVPEAFDAGDIHINDLLAIANYVLVMNSSVGVLSVLFDRPVIHTGSAFYADPGLNRNAATADQVLELLERGFEVDQNSRYRFLSYLIEDFYSFGNVVAPESQVRDSDPTTTDQIDYYRVNLLGARIVDTSSKQRFVDINAPVYDPFREWICSQNYQEAATDVKSAPRHPREAAKRARWAYHRGEYEEAARLFDHATHLAPNKPTHFREAAESFFALGDLDAALSRLQIAQQLSPNNKSISRRLREMKRPRWLQFASKPFPIKAE